MNERWYLTVVPILISAFAFVFSAGVYFGRSEVAADLRVLEQRVNGHENIDVHNGAMRRPVIERELAVIRSDLQRLEAAMQRAHP